jgi:hypothetical protein
MDPARGTPVEWPLRFTLAHWAALLPGLPPGTYDLFKDSGSRLPDSDTSLSCIEADGSLRPGQGVFNEF